MTDNTTDVSATKNGAALDPKADTIEEEEAIDLADIAAAAVTALGALVDMLPDHVGDRLIEQFEQRAADFRASEVDA